MPAAAVGLDGTILDGVLLSAETPVVPCWNRLPMGCSWSLYFAQMVTENRLENVEQLRHAVRLCDHGTPLVLASQRGAAGAYQRSRRQQGWYGYVDNIGVLGVDRRLQKESLVAAAALFDKEGLLVHEKEEPAQVAEPLGCELNGEMWQTRLFRKRRELISVGIEAFLRRRRAAGKALETLVGHCTHGGLVRRNSSHAFTPFTSLSVFITIQFLYYGLQS